jgi:hypothetical protein
MISKITRIKQYVAIFKIDFLLLGGALIKPGGSRMGIGGENHLPTSKVVRGQPPVLRAKTFHPADVCVEWGGFSAGQRLQGWAFMRKVKRQFESGASMPPLRTLAKLAQAISGHNFRFYSSLPERAGHGLKKLF